MWEFRNSYKILVIKPEEKKHSEDLVVDGRIILKWIVGISDWRIYIDLVQDRDRWQAFVIMVMKLPVP
jgi:hypothetical protein